MEMKKERGAFACPHCSCRFKHKLTVWLVGIPAGVAVSIAIFQLVHIGLFSVFAGVLLVIVMLRVFGLYVILPRGTGGGENARSSGTADVDRGRKYDDASWHYGGDFPKELPNEAGATHSGMFLAWAIMNGMAGEILENDASGLLANLKNRKLTPGQYLIKACDEKFIDIDLNEEGNAFAREYFDFENGAYASDYEKTLAQKLPTLYHVPDSWETYDKLAPVITSRFKAWKIR